MNVTAPWHLALGTWHLAPGTYASLQKILSSAGIASRRAAETYITEGRVSVNGETVTALGSKADPDADDIRVDGRRVKTAQRRLYILMYKPRGYITSRSDPQRRPTVIDLLTKGGVREYVYPVGRLDYESEGLMLLTSDGDLAAHLTHPSHGVSASTRHAFAASPTSTRSIVSLEAWSSTAARPRRRRLRSRK